MSEEKRLNKALENAGTSKDAGSDKLSEQVLDHPLKVEGTPEDQAKIVAVINRAAKSPTAKYQLEKAGEAGYSVDLVFVLGSNGGCSKQDKSIILSPQSSEAEKVGVLIHECRHAVQFENGIEDSCDKSVPRTSTIKTDLMKSRATEADAQATSAQALWELMEKADDMEPLRAFNKLSAGITNAYSQAVNENPEAMNDGTARTAAFKSWYDNDEIKFAYEAGYQLHIMKQRREEGLDGDDTYQESASPAEVVNQICVNEDGKGNYFRDDPNVLADGKFIDVDPESAKFFIQYFGSHHSQDPTMMELKVRQPSVNFQRRGVMENAEKIIANGEGSQLSSNEEKEASKIAEASSEAAKTGVGAPIVVNAETVHEHMLRVPDMIGPRHDHARRRIAEIRKERAENGATRAKLLDAAQRKGR